MRRMIAGAVLVAVLAGACGSRSRPASPEAVASRHPTTSTTAAVTTTTSTVPGSVAVGTLEAVAVRTPAPPLVVADAGNSILFDAEPAMAASLGAARFFPHTIGAFGVSVVPEVWRGVFGRDVPADDPAAVVVMLGNRDFPAAIADPATYRSQLDEAVRLMTARGARVLWLGLPPLPPSPTDELGRTAVNALFAELPARFPGVVRYVPTDTVLGDATGVFVRSAGGVPVRKENPDGTPNEHLCPAGAIRIAELVRRELAGVMTLPAAPTGWQDGPWRGDRRYDDPPDGCRV